MAESKGVWLDKDTGKVVRTQPSCGVQLVPPGKDVDEKAQALIDRYEANYEVALGEQARVETATTSEPKATPAKRAAKSTKKAAG